jgi:hypothetical protein
MKAHITTRHPVKNSLLSSRECMMAILFLLLCALAFTTNVAGGLIHLTLVAALVMFGIHFINRYRNGRVQLQPALSFYRLNATATHERNATLSHSVKNRIRNVI